MSLIIALPKSHSVTPNPAKRELARTHWVEIREHNKSQQTNAAAAAAAQLADDTAADDIATDKLGACGQGTANTPIQPTPPSGQQAASIIDTARATEAIFVSA